MLIGVLLQAVFEDKLLVPVDRLAREDLKFAYGWVTPDCQPTLPMDCGTMARWISSWVAVLASASRMACMIQPAELLGAITVDTLTTAVTATVRGNRLCCKLELTPCSLGTGCSVASSRGRSGFRTYWF